MTKTLTKLGVEHAMWVGAREILVCMDGVGAFPEFLVDGKCVGNVNTDAYFNYAQYTGYFIQGGVCHFVLPYESCPWRYYDEPIYVAGSFNGWGQGAGSEAWLMEEAYMGGKRVLTLKKKWAHTGVDHFKFVTASGQWLPVMGNAFNAVWDTHSNANYCLNPKKSGEHCCLLEVEKPYDLSTRSVLECDGESIAVYDGEMLFALDSKKRMGVSFDRKGTVFRVFAPRAKSVSVLVYKDLKQGDEQEMILGQDADGVWEVYAKKRFNGLLL